MTTNGQTNRHWVTVMQFYAADFLIFCTCIVIGGHLRLGEHFGGLEQLRFAWPGLVVGGLALASSCYIFGLYSSSKPVHALFQRGLLVALGVGIATLLMIAVFYLDMSSKLGRGIMALGVPLALVLTLVHHWWIHAWSRNFRERVIFLLIRPEDEDELELFLSLDPRHLDFVGVICLKPEMFLHREDVLGSVDQLESVTRQHQVSRCLVSSHAIYDEGVGRFLRHMRYSGISVVPLISLCEETEQFVPLELVTSDWLLHASGSPHMLYIRKVKRAVDICSSLIMLALVSPILLAGMLAVRLTSRGPIFYRQIRCGRFGREFQVIKLRTMAVDAETTGAVWAQVNDPRVTPVGAFLRKYRIDEIPQLFNVLRGEMSFVGPRPERPEFMEELAREIPYFRERLLVQPGITGWAQVKYPYGSTVADAKHKLEFDLYYMKHMSPFLDLFIFLDTVRIIITGGLNETEKEIRPFSEAARAYGDRKSTRREGPVRGGRPAADRPATEKARGVGFSPLGPVGPEPGEG